MLIPGVTSEDITLTYIDFFETYSNRYHGYPLP